MIHDGTMRVIWIDPQTTPPTIESRLMPSGDYKAFNVLLNTNDLHIARTDGAYWSKSKAARRIAVDAFCDANQLFPSKPTAGTRLPNGQSLAGPLILCSIDKGTMHGAAPEWLTVEAVAAQVQFVTVGPQ